MATIIVEVNTDGCNISWLISADFGVSKFMIFKTLILYCSNLAIHVKLAEL